MPWELEATRVQQATYTISTNADGLTGNSTFDATAPGMDILKIELPALTSAALSFQFSGDNSTFRDVYDQTNTEFTIPASTGNRFITLDNLSRLLGGTYFKIRSGTTGSGVQQASARTLTIYYRMLF